MNNPIFRVNSDLFGFLLKKQWFNKWLKKGRGALGNELVVQVMAWGKLCLSDKQCPLAWTDIILSVSQPTGSVPKADNCCGVQQLLEILTIKKYILFASVHGKWDTVVWALSSTKQEEKSYKIIEDKLPWRGKYNVKSHA